MRTELMIVLIVPTVFLAAIAVHLLLLLGLEPAGRSRRRSRSGGPAGWDVAVGHQSCGRRQRPDDAHHGLVAKGSDESRSIVGVLEDGSTGRCRSPYIRAGGGRGW